MTDPPVIDLTPKYFETITFQLNDPIKCEEKDFYHRNKKYLSLIDLSNKLKASDHNRQCGLNACDNMKRGECTSGTEAIKTTHPEHDVKRIKLQAND